MIAPRQLLSFLTYFGLLLGLSLPLQAQQREGILHLRDRVHQFLIYQHTQGHLPYAFLSHQPLSAYEANRYLDSIYMHLEELSPAEQRELMRLKGAQPGPGVSWAHRLLSFTYPDGENFIAIRTPDYAVAINPLLYLSAGKAFQHTPSEQSTRTTWQNTRGVQVSGHLGSHLFFEARVEENQTVLPLLASPLFAQRLLAPFSRDFLPEGGWDYWRVTGMIGVRGKFIEARFGRNRNQWGYGLGSLILSDFAPAYDQLQIRTTFWRFQFTNLYALTTDTHRRSTSTVDYAAHAPRFIAMHRLAFQMHRRFKMGFFEAVVLDPASFSSELQLLWTFMNPVIFYRAADLGLRSPGNMLIGLDTYWRFKNGIAWYNQLVLDEFKITELTSNRGWWANKWGILTGLHLTRLPIPLTELWIEYSRIRPYTYSSRSTTLAYVHYNGGLGYPTGPNTQNVALKLTSHPIPRWHGALLILYTQRGRNSEDQNFGSDPYQPYDTRIGDYGIRFLQGIRQNQWLIEARLGMELLPRMYLEAALRAEHLSDEELGTSQYINPFLLLRWGLPFQSLRF